MSIIEFTELGSFIDLPLRTYSTGMRARLSFGIATAVVPEILLLDEGIGAGDAAFIEKANQRLDELWWHRNSGACVAFGATGSPVLQQISVARPGRVVSMGEGIAAALELMPLTLGEAVAPLLRPTYLGAPVASIILLQRPKRA